MTRTGRSIALVQPTLDQRRGIQNLVLWTADELTRRGWPARVVTAHCPPGMWPQGPGNVSVLEALGGAHARRRPHLDATARRSLQGALDGTDIVVSFAQPAHAWVAQLAAAGALRSDIVAFCNEPSRHRFFVHTDRALHAWAQRIRPLDEVDHALLDFARRRAVSARGWRSLAFAWRCRREASRFRAFGQRLANSRYTAESLRRVTGLDAVVCELGIPIPERPATRDRPQPPLVLLVTTDHPVKNLARSLAALGQVARRGTPFALAIVGQATDSPDVRAFAARQGLDRLGHDLAWEGCVSDARLHGLLERAALLLYVPLDEPFGLLPLEALARGAAVVVPDHGGPAETLQHGETGWQVDAFDTEAIAEGVERMLRDIPLRSRLAAAGEARVRAAYSLSAFVARLEGELPQR